MSCTLFGLYILSAIAMLYKFHASSFSSIFVNPYLWIKIETVSLIQFRQANMSGIDIVIVWWARYQNWQCLIYFKSMEYPRTLELFHVFRGCRKGRYTTYTFTILKLWIALEKLTHWLHHQRNIAWIRKTASNPC